MFEDSLVESAALLRTHNRWPALLSLAAQLLAAAVVLSLPLLHPEALPLARSLSATLAPPRPPVPPPPRVHLRPQPLSAAAALSAPQSSGTPLLRPLLHPSGPPIDAPHLGIIDLAASSPALPPGIATAAPSGPRVGITPAGDHPTSGPARISSGISAGLLLSPIRPDYPPIARVTRTQGTVVVEAVISRSGTIESARVLSGPPVLQQAALAAVLSARYRPYLLNGQPTEVQTTFTIHFRLGT